MKDKLQQLLDEYQQNYNKFTYGHYLDPDNIEDAIKMGLVGCFYLDKAYKPEKRQAIGQVLALYDKHWGDKLKHGFFNANPNKLYFYQDFSLAQKLELINEYALDTLNFYWSNVDNLEFTPEYLIKTFSMAGWYEKVHKSISYVQFYLPINELKSFGVDSLVELIGQISEILQPMHGFFGLGIQHSHEYYDYQYLEYELAHKYLGLDISNDEADEHLRDGFKCINWLTILSDQLVTDKLGSLDELKQRNQDEAITFYPYKGGVVVRAGEVPELGDVSRNPYPKHYVNVNALLKPARAPEIASLGFGSINGEIRFNNRTSKEWQCRFDDVTATGLPKTDEQIEQTPDQTGLAVPIRIKTGELCPHTGLYSATINGKIEYRELINGDKVTPFIDSDTKQTYTDITWTLLRRDDGGSVYIKN
ncbi:type VI immunity family protein [Gilliamella sp. BG2]|uniref:type VI immunity family protein n=1 Tax=Gilliamella sp. BG2 TaxID=3351509 RepID=UPI00398871C4